MDKNTLLNGSPMMWDQPQTAQPWYRQPGYRPTNFLLDAAAKFIGQPLYDAYTGIMQAGGMEQDPQAPDGYVSQNALIRGANGIAEFAAPGTMTRRPTLPHDYWMARHLESTTPKQGVNYNSQKFGRLAEGNPIMGGDHYWSSARGLSREDGVRHARNPTQNDPHWSLYTRDHGMEFYEPNIANSNWRLVDGN